MMSPSMGYLDFNLLPIGPSGSSFQEFFVSSNEDLSEAFTSMDIPLDDTIIVFSNDHIFELGCPTIKPSLNFSFDFDLTIGEPSNIGVDEPSYSTIELLIGFPYEYDLLCRPLDSLNDEFVPTDYVIDVNYDLPIDFDLPRWRSSIFVVDEYFLVDSPKVIYIIEDMKFDDTHVQVTMIRLI